MKLELFLAFIGASMLLTSCPTLISRPIPVNKSVRFIYAAASDRAIIKDAYDGMDRSARNIQNWYKNQLGGKTFTLNNPAVETCTLPKVASAYYKNTRDLLLEDIKTCVPVKKSDPNFVWVVYADVDEECNNNTRLGVGFLGEGLTVMGRPDVQGMAGQASVKFPCDGPYEFSFDRWIGGTGHELGHALGLSHPLGCDTNQLVTKMP